MIQLKKTILTLVALLALTTQAWATDVYLVGNGDGNWLNGVGWDPGVAGNKMTEQNGVYSITFTNVAANPESPLQFKFAINGTWDMNYGCTSDDENKLNKTLSNIELFGTNFLFRLTETADVTISFNLSEMTYMISTKGMKVGDDTASGPEVAWDKNKKTGKFTMPGGNVTLEPEYYPQAALTAAPTAINDVPATTDGAIVNAGTVANIGETETAQGTVMYYVSPTALDDDALLALAADQWTADVPTAKSLAQGQAYVYYYVRGNDSDNDEENFSDGDILAANALTVNIAPEPTYAVTFAEGTDANEWKAEPATGVTKGETVTVTYTGSKKVIGVKAEKKGAPAEEPMTLGTPLTIEAITDGTIVVNIEGTLSTGMKYSVNGGTKTTITSTTNIEGLKAGDKVQFYGNGTSTQVYGNSPNVKILGSGDGFQTKAYGNTMSLLDEEGFATKTDLPDATFVFSGLFSENTTLTDASELLLPATTLTVGCYYGMFEGCTSLTTAPKLPATTMATGCYRGMFEGCTSLTTAPKLPATTLAKSCYYTMFFNCTSLTSAYVKAAYTEENGECDYMFDLSKAAGAVLHTTPDNKASWETMMNKDWKNWTVADDWQD